MSTTAQINANRENAKHSTGPTSQAGLDRTSQNARKHGITGKTLVIPPDEQDAYHAHVQSHMDEHKPTNPHHHELVQDLADSRWAVHQIFTQQTATVSLMNAVTKQMLAAGADPVAIIAATAQGTRTLATLGTYEGRKRRAAKSLKKELDELEQQIAERKAAEPTPNKTKPEPPIGSVCPDSAQAAHAQQFVAECHNLDALIEKIKTETGITDEDELFDRAWKLTQ